MPAPLLRVSRRPPDAPTDATPSEAVVSILASLKPSQDAALSHREFRELVQERARNAERQVWQPLRFAARTRGDW